MVLGAIDIKILQILQDDTSRPSNAIAVHLYLAPDAAGGAFDGWSTRASGSAFRSVFDDGEAVGEKAVEIRAHGVGVGADRIENDEITRRYGVGQ